ncbi:MAG: S9 family peptidase [Luminiphilus sp.]
MKPILLLTLMLSLLACQAEHDPKAPTQGDAGALQEPIAEKRPHVMEIHGDRRVDDYYWLRDDTRSDPEILAYLEQENAWTAHESQASQTLHATLYEEMVGRLSPEESSVPVLMGNYWYYNRYQAGQDFAIHARRAGNLEAEEEILLDGNARAEGHDFYSLANLLPSDDGRYIAIAEDFVGRRIHDIRILDTQSGEYLADQLTGAAPDLAWSTDGQFLFYIRRDPQTLLAKFVMRHAVGTASADDVMVYEETDDTFYTSLSRSRSGAWLVLQHTETTSTETQILLASNPTGEFQPVVPREAGHEYAIEDAGDMFFILSNWGAKNFRVMTADIASVADKNQWRELLPETEDTLLESMTRLSDWLVLEQQQNGQRKIWAVNTVTGDKTFIDADEPASAYWAIDNVNADTTVLRYLQTSLTKPNQTWEIDLATGSRTLLKEAQVPGEFNVDRYATRRIDVVARDGALIPVTLAFDKATPLDGSAPGLIYGYGSYGSSTLPYFNPALISLLDRGFVYAIAHIRGGQEKGRGWYEDGKMMNKVNTFTDFIDATAALQEQQIFDVSRTYARGGSAGGLLMGAVLNMAPDLYHGVIAAVPFVDVITTMLDPSIPLTTGEWNEWGDPREKAAYDYMLAYSPYDQVSEQAYPHLLVTTGLHDSQVQYFEPAKWVAKLRAKRTNRNKLMLYTDMSAGHSGASGRLKRFDDYAREFSFLVSLANEQDARNVTPEL